MSLIPLPSRKEGLYRSIIYSKVHLELDKAVHLGCKEITLGLKRCCKVKDSLGWSALIRTLLARTLEANVKPYSSPWKISFSMSCRRWARLKSMLERTLLRKAASCSIIKNQLPSAREDMQNTVLRTWQMSSRIDPRWSAHMQVRMDVSDRSC